MPIRYRTLEAQYNFDQIYNITEAMMEKNEKPVKLIISLIYYQW